MKKKVEKFKNEILNWLRMERRRKIQITDTHVGELIANTPWLVTGYGKYGLIICFGDYGLWKNLKLSEAKFLGH